MAPPDLPEKMPHSMSKNPQRRHQGLNNLERKIESRIHRLLSATNTLSFMLMTSNQNTAPVTQQNQASGFKSLAAHQKAQADASSSSSISSNYRRLSDSKSPAAQPKPQAEDAPSLSVSTKHRISESKSPAVKPKHASSLSKTELKSQVEDTLSPSVISKRQLSGLKSPAAQPEHQAEDASPSTLSFKHWEINPSKKSSSRQQKHKKAQRAKMRLPPAPQKPLPALPSSFDWVRSSFSSKGVKFAQKRQELQEQELLKEQELFDIALNQYTTIERVDNPCHMLPGHLLVNHLQLKSAILRLEVLKTESRLHQTELSRRTALKSPPASQSGNRSVIELESDLFRLTRSSVCRLSQGRESQSEDEGVYENATPFLSRPKGKAMKRTAQAIRLPASADGLYKIATPVCRKSKRTTTSIVTTNSTIMTSTLVKCEDQSPTSISNIDKEMLVGTLPVSDDIIATSPQESSRSPCTYESDPLTENSSVPNPDDYNSPLRPQSFHCDMNKDECFSSAQSNARQWQEEK